MIFCILFMLQLWSGFHHHLFISRTVNARSLGINVRFSSCEFMRGRRDLCTGLCKHVRTAGEKAFYSEYHK